MTAAVTTTKTDRSSADSSRIWRRDQRSMSTPANGPIREYGKYKTVNADAAAAGLGNEVALKNTYVPTPAVTMPSPAWEVSRTAHSLTGAANRPGVTKGSQGSTPASPEHDGCVPARPHRHGRDHGDVAALTACFPLITSGSDSRICSA